MHIYKHLGLVMSVVNSEKCDGNSGRYCLRLFTLGPDFRLRTCIVLRYGPSDFSFRIVTEIYTCSTCGMTSRDRYIYTPAIVINTECCLMNFFNMSACNNEYVYGCATKHTLSKPQRVIKEMTSSRNISKMLITPGNI